MQIRSSRPRRSHFLGDPEEEGGCELCRDAASEGPESPSMVLVDDVPTSLLGEGLVRRGRPKSTLSNQGGCRRGLEQFHKVHLKSSHFSNLLSRKSRYGFLSLLTFPSRNFVLRTAEHLKSRGSHCPNGTFAVRPAVPVEAKHRRRGRGHVQLRT